MQIEYQIIPCQSKKNRISAWALFFGLFLPVFQFHNPFLLWKKILSSADAQLKINRSVASEKAQQKHVVVGFSQIGLDGGWRSAETKSILAEAKKRGIELKFSDAKGKQENQFKAIRSFIAEKVNAIILASLVETGWESVLQEAKDAGIPVILVDRGVKVADSSLYVTSITADFVEEGRAAARWLAISTHCKANIIELQGTLDSTPAIGRQAGFAQALKEHPEMKNLKSQSAGFSRQDAREIMQALLKSDGKNITAVFAHNDEMALGAIEAIEKSGFRPGKDIQLISIDGVRSAFQAIVAGKLNATVECTPLLGPGIFDAVYKALTHESMVKKMTLQGRIFDVTNAKKAIANREY